MLKGILVALEGIDGAGKSTQIRLLTSFYEAQGFEVVATKEPTDGPYGRQIRQSAQTGRLPVLEEYALFNQDREEHVRTTIQPSLERGAIVLVDRYYFSTAAYQGIRGLNPEQIIEESEARFPRPDLLVVLDLPVDLGLSRVRARGVADAFERRADLEACALIFRSFTGPDVLTVDATQTPEALTPIIVEAMQACLAARDTSTSNPE